MIDTACPFELVGAMTERWMMAEEAGLLMVVCSRFLRVRGQPRFRKMEGPKRMRSRKSLYW